MAMTLAKRIRLASIDPLRRPDWCWRLVLDMLGQDRRATAQDDPAIRQALAFARARIRQARGFAGGRASSSAQRWPEVSRAYLIYQSEGESRSEIEARLLAGDSFETIAARTGESIPVLQLFESLFYKLCDSLAARDWILDAIIADAPGRAEPTQEQTWRYIGYFGGPFILDLLIAEDLHRTEPRIQDRALLAEMARQVARGFFLSLDARTSYNYLRQLRAIRRKLKLPRKRAEEAITRNMVDFLHVAAGKASGQRQCRRPADDFPIGEELFQLIQENRYTRNEKSKVASKVPTTPVASPSPQKLPETKDHRRPASLEPRQLPRRLRANRLRAIGNGANRRRAA